MKYLILNQLGTPKSPDPADVGAYLSEFLMDGDVLGLPRPFRDILVHIGIVPRRKYFSAEKYKKIWTSRGSPLLFNTEDLAKKIQALLGTNWKVIIGMRYAEPSIQQALTAVDFKNAEKILFLPLYPHSAGATTGSAVKCLTRELEKISLPVDSNKKIQVLPTFGGQEWFIQAQSEKIKNQLSVDDHLLLSYHGLPVRQENKEKLSYKAQCLQTSDLIQKYLGLANEKISSSFQSRVGVTEWIGPYTVETAIFLARSGVKNLKVACPSFVADCLETEEEIAIELKEIFLNNGGENFELIRCLNDDISFVKGLVKFINL